MAEEKTTYIRLCCENCGNEDTIQTKEWRYVKSGEFAGDASNDTEDNWCEHCNDHVNFTNKEEYLINRDKDEFREGDEVYWSDPDEEKSSGIYKIVKQVTEDDEDSIYLISNGTSESEVYKHELR